MLCYRIVLIAIFVTTNAYENQPLPDWPRGLSLSSLFATYLVLLKAGILLFLVQRFSFCAAAQLPSVQAYLCHSFHKSSLSSNLTGREMIVGTRASSLLSNKFKKFLLTM